ncbi:N,N-dimethylformamidase beta subunit family domain-containing protein [Streptomyces sp. NBC_01431]|uniref:N,N-dimethylformamidase beta subunit family domain-containing protein n=1 Tax=Streptomyces sp. NBC_01431 TaxID=2903863 RepID=UPI002E322BB1|nr:N,N-dimethylformamidase beta subunit family domain-containing protein [Streptomyces sp. NBC_01431]
MDRAAFSRRAFLGAAGAVAAAGAAGCSSGEGPGKDGPSEGGASKPPAKENDRPGDAGWRLKGRGAEHEVEGYADRTSVAPGEAFRLHVHTTAKTFRAEAFRMGWYAGALARKVWESGPVKGVRQPAAKVEPGTYTVTADWPASTEVPTKDWPEGSYLVRLTADSGGQRYVPVTVRSATTKGRVVIVNAVATWQAYNEWGGYSLYNGPTGDDADRSRAVSCDRPYHRDGDGLFLTYEQPVVALAEKMGLAPAYVTTMDIERDARLLDGATAVLSLGHDEYWTQSMRERVTAVRDRGTNIAFLGANACFRRIRLEKTGLGDHRLIVCYKNDWAKDPGRREGEPPTTNFREPPHAQPENSLTGTLYESNPTTADYVVTSPGHWLFEGTGVKHGSAFPGLVGTEYDRANGEESTPRPIEVVSHSPLTCRGVHSYANSAYYTVSSGAGVFNTGTMRWVQSTIGDGGHGIDATTAKFTSRVTENLLRIFAAGPAGRSHPAKDNLDTFHPYAGDPTWAKRNLW